MIYKKNSKGKSHEQVSILGLYSLHKFSIFWSFNTLRREKVKNIRIIF